MEFLKNFFLEQFGGSTISTIEVFVSLITAFVIGIFIIFIYRKTYSGVIYSKSFSLCLVLLAMVSALIIRTIGSNLALSLGMVGSLSIVRFRTAVKEPVDTAFMFWAIVAGIMSGAGVYLVALVSSVALGLLYFLGYCFGYKTVGQYLLVVRYQGNIESMLLQEIGKLTKFKLKTRSVINGLNELTYEIEIKDKEARIVDILKSINGVASVSVISYQNDFGV